jgi:hypothetical protein
VNADVRIPEDMLYARGFTLSRDPEERPHRAWRVHEIGGWFLSYDPRLDFSHGGAEESAVAVLGLAIDTDTWSDQDDTARHAASALERGEDELFDLLDAWAGRHLIVWSKGGRVSVMTDATAMRTCFFNLEGELRVASHASLVAELAEAPRRDLPFAAHRRFRKGVHYFPGRITAWEGVVFLTANTVLDLESREVRRVWPRRSLPERSIEAAVEELSGRLPAQFEWLTATGRPVVVSITGGGDSRVTVAASRSEAEQLSYFTYYRRTSEVQVSDVRIASQIAATLGLRHIELPVPEDLGPSGEVTKEALQVNSFLSHFRAGAELYRRTFPAEAIHVRSNVAEVGRRFFEKSARAVPITHPKSMARVWRRMEDDADAVAAFAEWSDAVGFLDVAEVDPLDLFYWEHRMPCWHGSVVLESDVAFESHSLFNSRAVLENLLSVPQEARRKGELFTRFVATAWPELAGFPIVSAPPPATSGSRAG